MITLQEKSEPPGLPNIIMIKLPAFTRTISFLKNTLSPIQLKQNCCLLKGGFLGINFKSSPSLNLVFKKLSFEQQNNLYFDFLPIFEV
jgi:hypothetical protein